MQMKMGSGELLDAQGRLVERGWATHEVRRFFEGTGYLAIAPLVGAPH